METPPELLADDPQIAHCLDTLCAWLVLMPPAERAEVRQEVRQHLVSLVVAEQQNGLSRDEAVAAALQRLGPADALGKRMHKVWLDKDTQQPFPNLSPATRKQLSIFRSWSLVCLLLWLGSIFGVLSFFPSYATWPLFLILGSVTGTVNGVRQAMFHASLPEKRPPNPVAIAEACRSLLPPLPDHPSPALQRQHQKKTTDLLWIKSYMERPTNRLYHQDPAVIRMEISSIAYMAALTLGMNLFAYHHLHLNWPVFKVVVASALMFLMQELSAVLISRLLYRRSQAKSPK